MRDGKETIRLPAYTAGAGAYQGVSREAAKFGGRLLLAGGRRALAAGQKKLVSSLSGGARVVHTEILTGLCTDREAEELAELSVKQGAELLCGMGGGRALDTVKAAGELAKLPVFTFPTIAATCAAVTGLSVMHGEDGAFSRLLPLKNPPAHAFIDTEILAKAPPCYLRAGLGDSLAKHVETEFSARGAALGHGDRLALSIAEGLLKSIEEEGAQALVEAAAGRAGEALEDMSLLSIVSVGCVSLLISEAFNCALAHSLNYALDGLPALRGCLHGDMVAWGAAVQLVMDDQQGKALRVLRLLRALGIPCSLREMGADWRDAALTAAIRNAALQPDMERTPYPVSPDRILEAVLQTESMALEV